MVLLSRFPLYRNIVIPNLRKERFGTEFLFNDMVYFYSDSLQNPPRWNGLDACIFQRGVSYFGITVDAGYPRLFRFRNNLCNHPQIQINNTTPPHRKAQLPRHFNAGAQLFSGWLQYQQQPTFLFLKIIVLSSTVDYNNPILQRSP